MQPYYVEASYGPRGKHTGYVVRNASHIISKSSNRKFGGWRAAKNNAEYICNTLNNAQAHRDHASFYENIWNVSKPAPINPHLSALGLETMPADLAHLKTKFRQSCRKNAAIAAILAQLSP